MRQTSLATLGLVLAVGVGCDDGCSPEPSFAWKGERVTVYGFGHSESDACAGSFGALEDRIGMVEEFLGVGEGRRYEYWWMSDRDWQEIEPCPIEAAACTTQEGVAVSRQLPDMHEAVHMVARSIGGDGCPFVLNEGIAEYLTDPRLSDWAPSEEQPLAELLNTENFPFTRETYVRSAHFVAYLVDGYGPDSIRNLCAAIPRYDTTISDWESAFLEVLGVSLAELLADYQDYYPTCSLAQFRARLWGCDGDPDYTFTQNDRSFVVESDCADPRATNAYFGKRGDATITRLVHFPTDAWILLRATAEGPSGKGAIVTTQQCASCESDPQIIREGDNSGNIYKYRPGLHQVTVFFDKRDAVQLTMTKLP